jgi:hypothetical protein
MVIFVAAEEHEILSDTVCHEECHHRALVVGNPISP